MHPLATDIVDAVLQHIHNLWQFQVQLVEIDDAGEQRTIASYPEIAEQ